MMRSLFAASLLFSFACGSAYGDRGTEVASTRDRVLAPSEARAPYDVSLLDEAGNVLHTYSHRGRFYVLGGHGERYTIRVKNPTANRIEAVVTVDGLDVVDGEAGDLNKRGYIVPPYGEVNIDGFRTSTDNVATFRFSSVANSYAGQKGAARNVGVIAVALFEEIPPPAPTELILGDKSDGAPRRSGAGIYDYRDDMVSGGSANARTSADEARAEPAAPQAGVGGGRVAAKRVAPSTTATGTASARAPSPRPADDRGRDQRMEERDFDGDAEYAARSRPGLGTEFGESRMSSVSYTRFERNGTRPIAIAELRYNNASGLSALGIELTVPPDDGELTIRETADPFPGDHRFARPPR